MITVMLRKALAFILAFVFFSTGFSAMPALAASVVVKATVTYVKGMARKLPKSSGSAVTLSLGDTVYEGDTIVTLDKTKVELTFASGQMIRLGSQTRLMVQNLASTPKGGLRGLMRAMSGRLWYTMTRLASDSDIRIVTPYLVVAVKGTVFRTDIYEDQKTDVYVYDGVVEASGKSTPPVQVPAREKATGAPSAAVERSVFDEATDEADEWVRWNKNRDKLRVLITIAGRLGDKHFPVPAAENTVIRRFLDNYLFKVIDKDQVDRIRETERIKAALRGDNAAAASAGLELAADVVIVGDAVTESFKTPLPGQPYSARVSLTGRVVRCDTAEVIAAYVPSRASRGIDVTAEAATQKVLISSSERMASVFVDSIVEGWRRESRMGATIDVIVEGADYEKLERIVSTFRGLAGVKDVQKLYLIQYRALLAVDFSGDSVALADGIIKADFGTVKVSVVGLSAYRLEIEVSASDDRDEKP